jgi:C-terminal processing protease CtpA/Prc
MFGQANQLPKFEELYQLLRTNSGSLSDSELNQAAVKGLLDELQAQVVLVTNAAPDNADTTNALIQASVFNESFAYFRVGKIEGAFDKTLKEDYQKLVSTNKLKGAVLDLRYANGTDYSAAAKAADLFIKTEQPLLHWGEKSANATAKTDAIALPVAVLVNHQTAGAAEALAGILRETQVGLVIGANTAGQASVFKEFELANGHRLKIATAPVKLGDGEEIPKDGLKPDIQVSVSAEDEKAFYDDPYRALPKPASLTGSDTNNLAGNSDTNRPRRRLNEAELVRMQREGVSFDPEISSRPERKPEPSKPMVTDPALVRALDVLKGLSIVQQSRRL